MIDDLQHSDDNAITLSILPCVAMHKCGLCRRAVSVRLFVRLSVCRVRVLYRSH